ncbi:MAG: YlbF family regulator [Ruminococcaceae bacterium]|nr:YlbF family regulator [Oscillospiraceae bacterium]MBQ8793277.1 YlbF family regulator [Clostridia bacterium]
MGIIEATRNLGVEIQKDERFIRFIKAKLANDNDETLQNQIGEFNTIRMNLDREMNAETQDENKIKELNEKLREIYTAVMSSKTMLEYNTAKAEVDAMLNDINSIIMQCVEGEDPMTAEPHTACTGSCSTCGGCH